MLVVTVSVCCTLNADPIAVRKIGPLAQDRNYVAITAAIALWAESLVVVLLARRRHWMQDAAIWFLITTATYVAFIVVPVHMGLEFNAFGDVHGLVALTLEATIVVCEALILWAIWLRKVGFLRALAVSFIGNLTSYGISLLFLYHAFEVHFKALH